LVLAFGISTVASAGSLSDIKTPEISINALDKLSMSVPQICPSSTRWNPQQRLCVGKDKNGQDLRLMGGCPAGFHKDPNTGYCMPR
jgi:hypothetical protein